MIWSGVIAVFAGALMAFAVGGDIGPVDVHTAGAITMIFGAAVLVTGLLRARTRRRRPDTPVTDGRPVAGGRGVLTVDGDQRYRMSKGKMIAMIAAAVYILSPIDIVPDAFLPVGVIDDATALTWLLFAIGQEVSRRRRSPV